jgi:hypothetical protein
VPRLSSSAQMSSGSAPKLIAKASKVARGALEKGCLKLVMPAEPAKRAPPVEGVFQ